MRVKEDLLLKNLKIGVEKDLVSVIVAKEEEDLVS